MQSTLILISDYGAGDPAFTEVMLQLRSLLPETFIHPQSTPPFSTISTGFWIAQIALTPNLKNTYIFSNTAPRKENKEAQKNNAGEKLMYIKLKNGFELMAINAGYNLSFIKEEIARLHLVTCENQGSQFRSRDIYPFAVAKMIHKDPRYKGDPVNPKTIPDYPTSVIASVDGYGNIKTTIRETEITFEPGKILLVSINSVTHPATFTDGTFNIPEGTLAFAPGSSGCKNRFMELFYRGKNAAKLFNQPYVEQKIVITVA